MDNPKISLIMPIYNVEDYLEDTLDDLLRQTFIDEMEVLMIDDGSSDQSRYIIEKYALDHDNFRVFHKQNEGAAMARNFGIREARGEYICFFDGDDYLDFDKYERLYKIASENDSDIVTSPIIRFRRYMVFDGLFYKNSLKKFDTDIPSTEFTSHPELLWDLFITNKLYRRQLVEDNNLTFIEEKRYYCDDAPFSLKAYLLAERISITTESNYYWRVRENATQSSTQQLTQVKNFKDRIYAAMLCLNVFKDYNIDDSCMKAFYLKVLNYDLYVHFSKFHMYDSESHLELIQMANELLSRIPDEYKEELNSFKRVMYAMVENEAVDDLVKFTSMESQLKENPHVPESLGDEYAEMIDFDRDVIDEDMVVRKEQISLEDDSLIVEFSKRIDYLRMDYPCSTAAKLVDENGNEYPLDEKRGKITVPVDLIKDKKHMKIRVECSSETFTKESYLLNTKREVFSMEGFDVEIAIETNRIMRIDVRPTSDLSIEFDEVSFTDDVFEFRGTSSEAVSDAYIQNVIGYNRFSYPVECAQADKGYEISFSISHEDILSFPVRKWELKTDLPFKKIRLTRKYQFYMPHTMVYMINARNKVLISSDIYNPFERLDDLYEKLRNSNIENRKITRQNSKLERRNQLLSERVDRLKEKNEKLSDKNKKLKEKNSMLKITVDEYKSRKVVRFADKIKH